MCSCALSELVASHTLCVPGVHAAAATGRQGPALLISTVLCNKIEQKTRVQFAARACACIYDTMHMFALHTLPWYWKALILVYDVAKCWQQQNAHVRNSVDVHATTVHVFLCQLLFAFVLMGPSLLLSVKDRRRTSMFVSEMLLLLSSYLWLIRGIATKMLSPAHACF